MSKLGISVYPNRSKLEDDIEYLYLASKYGFQRIFLSLLSVQDENSLNKFKDIVKLARKLDMEVVADVAPDVFKDLNVDYKDLRVFIVYDCRCT